MSYFAENKITFPNLTQLCAELPDGSGALPIYVAQSGDTFGGMAEAFYGAASTDAINTVAQILADWNCTPTEKDLQVGQPIQLPHGIFYQGTTCQKWYLNLNNVAAPTNATEVTDNCLTSGSACNVFGENATYGLGFEYPSGSGWGYFGAAGACS